MRTSATVQNAVSRNSTIQCSDLFIVPPFHFYSYPSCNIFLGRLPPVTLAFDGLELLTFASTLADVNKDASHDGDLESSSQTPVIESSGGSEW